MFTGFPTTLVEEVAKAIYDMNLKIK